MIREIKKDRAGVIPYVLYFILSLNGWLSLYEQIDAYMQDALFKMAKLGSCGDNLWAFGEYRTSDADRTVQQTGEVILFCYDMDEYYFIYGIHGRFVSYHGNSSSKCCDVVSF